MSEGIIHNLYKPKTMSLSDADLINVYIVIISGLLGALCGFKIVLSSIIVRFKREDKDPFYGPQG